MPVTKTARYRNALRKAATSGESCYFLGTDSAPHPIAKKLSVNGQVTTDCPKIKIFSIL
jgi:dihydroorotase